MEQVDKICRLFQLKGTPVSIEAFGEGHINDTFRIVTDSNTVYVLQRMNHGVFADIDGLMKNVMGVTEHIHKKVSEMGGDPDRQSLTIVLTADGKPYVQEGNNYWRVYLYIKDSITLQTAQTTKEFRSAGLAFGTFQKLLADYPADELTETIPNFHNTPNRYENFRKAVQADTVGLAHTAQPEIDFVKRHADLCHALTDQLAEGRLPLRVTHNDTKINNCMLDSKTGEPLVVIDLDTVMPGLAAYDFGDSIRFGATHAAEDEKDLSKVDFDLDLYTGFAEGFLQGCGADLSTDEILSLATGAVVMTLECGMRFLTDYLEGSHYFKTAYPEHNLIRCRTQFRLVELMLDNMDQMQQIVTNIANRL